MVLCIPDGVQKQRAPNSPAHEARLYPKVVQSGRSRVVETEAVESNFSTCDNGNVGLVGFDELRCERQEFFPLAHPFLRIVP